MDKIANEPDVLIGAGGGAYSAINKPTLWYRLGFHYGSDGLFDWRNEKEPGLVDSALTTEVHVMLTFVDRLRLLLTGHLGVTVYTKTDVLVNHAKSRSAVAVLPPR